MWRGKRIAKVPLTKATIDSLKTAVMDVVKGYNWKFYTPANNLGEIIVIG